MTSGRERLQGMSMFLLPTDTPGVKIVRNVGLHGERDNNEGSHALIPPTTFGCPTKRCSVARKAFIIAELG